mmetsp:Transcript_14360/g.26864  ORF Transcript_14360/g.26864 Transcript_14360/m.26864 type:complete len:207 (-) Transcript_14360:223-843(-)
MSRSPERARTTSPLDRSSRCSSKTLTSLPPQSPHPPPPPLSLAREHATLRLLKSTIPPLSRCPLMSWTRASSPPTTCYCGRTGARCWRARRRRPTPAGASRRKRVRALASSSSPTSLCSRTRPWHSRSLCLRTPSAGPSTSARQTPLARSSRTRRVAAQRCRSQWSPATTGRKSSSTSTPDMPGGKRWCRLSCRVAPGRSRSVRTT